MTATRRSLTCGLLLLIAGSGAAAQSRDLAAALASIDTASIDAHLAYLASDPLAGRAPGTAGGRAAADYIADRFQAAGLGPLPGASFFQDVPLLGWRADTATTWLIAGRGIRGIRVQDRSQIVLWSPVAARRVSLDGPVVFAGYGIDAPEYGWHDYAGDVRGRIVLLLPGEPALPDAFDGDALTYYGRWSYKVEEAGRRGASAVLLVHSAAGAGYDWNVVRNSWGGEVLALAEDTSAALPGVVGWVRQETARRLVARAGHSLEALQQRAGHRDFEPVELELPVRLQLQGRTRAVRSPNVVAALPGRHAARAAEWVIYTAHYDHLGVGEPVAGDSIFNGAYDNASGVSLLLAVARAFALPGVRPDRSLLFIATTGEEAGLLGATHFTRHAPVRLADVAAVINLDGANLWGETEDIGAIGAERSTLGESFARVAAQQGLRAVAERAPEQGFFFRSDQFPFARAGVPALSLEHGLRYRGRPPHWGDSTVGDYLRRTYHQPADNYSAAFDLRGAVQQARVAFLLGHAIASRTGRPAWYELSGRETGWGR